MIVTLVKKDFYVFGHLESGSMYSLATQREEDAVARTYRALKRDFPDENPMDWELQPDEQQSN